MKRRSPLRNSIEHAAVRAVFALLGTLPRSLGNGLARTIWWLIDLVVPRLRRTALRNLELAYPELALPQRHALVDGVLRSLSRLLWVTAYIASDTRRIDSNLIEIEGLGIVEAAFQQGKGVLFLTGHVGAWELSALAFGKLVRPMDVVSRPLDNPLVEAMLNRIRSSTGNRILGKSGIARDVLRALEGNRAVGFLVDHNVISPDRCFVDFFGIKTSASTVFAKLAARSGATVIPGFALWDETAKRFVLRFQEPVPITGDAEEDTQRVHTVIERIVRQHPDQWMWLHRRFKTRPDGEGPIY